MIRKAILIEDKPIRQENMLTAEQLGALKELKGLTLPENTECRDVIDSLNNRKTNVIEEYDLVMMHRSSLKASGFNSLDDYCKKKQKSLVLFTGNQGQTSLRNEGYELLSLGSNVFYSSRLCPFLQGFVNGEESHLLSLVYGNSWRLSVLLEYHEKLELLTTEKDKDIIFQLKTEISDFEKVFEIHQENAMVELKRLILNL